MPVRLIDELFVGGLEGCPFEPHVPTRIVPGTAVPRAFAGVDHACKHPCHARAVKYAGTLPKTHPNYLWVEKGIHLALNMIDPDEPLFVPETFVKAMDFIDAARHAGPVLVHCNQGLSRAPSIALVYLAKRTSWIGDVHRSFEEARDAFSQRWPWYAPGRGLVKFLTVMWPHLR